MARVPCSLTANIIIYLSLHLSANLVVSQDRFASEFDTLKIINLTKNENFTKVQFEVRGKNILRDLQIKTTQNEANRNAVCTEDWSFPINEISVKTDTAIYELLVPRNVTGNLYLCLPHENREFQEDGHKSPPDIFIGGPHILYHQGRGVVIKIPHDGSAGLQRNRRQENGEIQVLGMRLEIHEKDAEFDEDGVPEVLAHVDHVIRIFGKNFVDSMVITFTDKKSTPERTCQFPKTNVAFTVINDSFSPETVKVKINLPGMGDSETLYMCTKESNSTFFVHQGDDVWLQIRTYETALPLAVTILIVITCLMFSALFSGLNLGLMSLDRTELKILCNTGTAQEQKYARAIQPVRNHGNFLLCSILLGNVFVNSIFTILLDGLTSGLVAVVFSTIAIVLFGEITPQALCSRHGLAVGAKTIYITKFVMVLTFPLAYPVSKILDCILGEEIGNVYNRERLKELVKVTTDVNDLDKDEVNIISGALELRRKTVVDVMTKIEDVFMLDYDSVLDFETVSEIMKSGYSRVPVYEGNRQNIVTMLYIKDLAFVDPDDNTPLKTLCQFYQNPCNFVFEDVTLDVMFKIFKEGNKGHMAFVHRVNNEGEGDPFYETIGIITLEDVIEELIQAEIMDETDVFTDNRSKRRRNADRRQDFSVFAERRGEANRIRISPQLTLASYQFLSTTVEFFLPSVISETILKRLLKQDIVFHVKKNKEWRTDPGNIVYQQGKSADYFVLILEGRVEVTIGKENLTFEAGPFTYFGTQALIQTIGIAESPSAAPTSALGSLESLHLDALVRHTFQPDYSVRASTEVIYLRIKRSLYLAAKRATLMERSQRDHSTDHFDEEMDKLLHSLEEDDTESGGRRTPRKRSSKNLSQVPDTNLSPKTPSLYSNVSPPHRISQRDINGSIMSSPVDDTHLLKDEEISLLSKKS